MFRLKRLIGGSVLVFILAGAALAQENRAPVGTDGEPVVAVAPLVTAAASARRVRFVSPGTVVQLRLEIYNDAGQKLFDTELHGGNVLDWHLQDGAGQRLPAGSYACVLTIKSLSGRLSQRVGVVTVNDDKAAVETGGPALSPAQQQTIGPVEANAAFTIVQESETEAITAVTHDGTEGQLGRTRGALSFRLGDVFSGKDKEQMRLTEDGSLGLGTSEPKAKLDVAGTIRAERVVIARPKSASAASDTSLDPEAAEIDQPLVAGTGTQNKIAKWTDGAGTLGDSVITELGGNLGIGTTNPESLLHLAGPGGVSGITLNTPGSHRFRFQTLPGIVNWGALTLNANYNYPSGWVLDEATTNGWFFKLDNRGGNNSGPLSGLWLYRVPPGAGAHTDEVPMFGVSSAHAFFDGNVGIGTNNPLAKLQVAGNVNFTGLRTESTASTPNVIGGNSSNTVTPGVVAATIWGGGPASRVTDNYGTVGGGGANTAGDSAGTTSDRNYATVAGGFSNIASGRGSTVGGGGDNIASGNGSTAGGGEGNRPSGENSTVGGGFENFAQGSGSTVPGGLNNTAQGNYSLAAGQHARAVHHGSFVWSDSTPGLFDFFSSTADNQFLINATGGVGIGTNAPSARLHVVGVSNALATPIAIVESTGNQVPLSFRRLAIEVARIRSDGSGNLVFATLNGGNKDIYFRAGDDAGTDMFIQSASGNIGIGTTTPTALLHVNGSVKIAAPSAGMGAALCRDAGTSLVVDCSASSARYKQNILGLRLGLDVVRRLRPVSFIWKQDGKRDIGLVAEEVNRVEPLLATHNDKGDVEGVRYDRLGVVLLNAVQEQQTQIKAQQQQLQAKNARINNLEARLARYDARLASLDQRLRRGRTAYHARRRNRR